MANISSIHSVGDSIVRFLSNSYPETLRSSHNCNFKVISSGELEGDTDFGTTLSLYLYRVTINEHVRNQPMIRDPRDAPSPLSLDLHFMLIIWADNAVAEHTICAWAMNELHRHPIMDMSLLSPDGGWKPDDVIHIIPAELSNEDLMRIWDAITPSYRLSLSYIARVVRIQTERSESDLPVVAARYSYNNKGDASVA